MNKYQKLISQIVKDNLKKELYIELGTSFRRQRKLIRFGMRDMSLQDIQRFKHFCKNLSI